MTHQRRHIRHSRRGKRFMAGKRPYRIVALINGKWETYPVAFKKIKSVREQLYPVRKDERPVKIMKGKKVVEEWV